MYIVVTACCHMAFDAEVCYSMSRYLATQHTFDTMHMVLCYTTVLGINTAGRYYCMHNALELLLLLGRSGSGPSRLVCPT